MKAMKGVNHRNKIGRLHKDAIPHLWDAFHANSSFGSTSKVGFQVGMYTCTERKESAMKNKKKWKGKMNENHRKMF